MMELELENPEDIKWELKKQINKTWPGHHLPDRSRP